MADNDLGLGRTTGSIAHAALTLIGTQLDKAATVEARSVEDQIELATGLSRALLRPILQLAFIGLVGVTILTAGTVTSTIITHSPWPATAGTGLVAVGSGLATFAWRNRKAR